MEIEIKNRTENKLLEREEIEFDVLHDGEATPSLQDVRGLLRAELNSKDELTVVDGIETEYGWGRDRGFAKVYQDRNQLEDIEPRHVLEKNFPSPEEES